MLPSFCKQSVIRLRPTTRTVRGSEIFDWSDTDELTIRGCSVQPAASTMTEDGRELGVSDGLTIYMPPSADVKAGDRIRFEGADYEIQGEPRIWPSVGNLAHKQVNVMRWYG